MSRTDGVLCLEADNPHKLAQMMNSTKELFAVNATQTHPPGEGHHAWVAFVYYVRRFTDAERENAGHNRNE